MKIPLHIINEAKHIARKSNVKRAKVSALLCSKAGSVICSASNRSYYGDLKKTTIHAEEFLLARVAKMAILSRIGQSGLYIFVTRVHHYDQFGMAKPCIKCSKLLKEVSIPVYYTNEMGEIKKW